MNKIIIKDLEKTVGTATVIEDGLYYCITCDCNFPKEGIYKLVIKCGSKQVNLGTCLLDYGKYVLKKKVSIRSLGRGELQIWVEQNETYFYPIKKDRVFPYIAEISRKKLKIMNGEIGINLEPGQALPDNDQNLIHLHE